MRPEPGQRRVGSLHSTAECENCGWMKHDGHVLEAARKHAEDRGHLVYVLQERGIYFEGRP